MNFVHTWKTTRMRTHTLPYRTRWCASIWEVEQRRTSLQEASWVETKVGWYPTVKSSYWTTHDSTHQICLSHIIRDLTFFDQALTPDTKDTPHPVLELKEISTMLSSGIHEANEARKAGTGPPGLSYYPKDAHRAHRQSAVHTVTHEG